MLEIMLSIALYVWVNPGGLVVNPGGKDVVLFVELEYNDLDTVEEVPGYLVTVCVVYSILAPLDGCEGETYLLVIVLVELST